ncbi:DUF2252 domain-containing protein [Granulicella arctica]|uniref:DUF2252 domain-containing protein n=1 Tax=Granulicella arctica TaxID=940613 RepID=UPI0021E04034|nr:DUF2252 domain-containing protein [Granulicella arctica]
MGKQVIEIKPGDRLAVLEKRRKLKMARSAHAYVRGNTIQFYEWLQGGEGAKLPQGPAIWICGDCHAGNLGPVANADGAVEIQIRDLDQTVIGNPAHDLIRLGLSLATAARGSDLPGVTTAVMLEQMVQGYRDALSSPRKPLLDCEDEGPVQMVLESSMKRSWRHLAEERIEDVTPKIPLGDRFWALTQEERTAIDETFAQEDVRQLINGLEKRENDGKIRVLDAAYWMKGCSSLGRMRYAVLLGIGRKRDRKYCLVDLKEAVKAAAPASSRVAMPADNAQRVVTGACSLSPYLGERMLATRFLQKPVVMRELMPQDLKLEMEQLTSEQAVAAARYLSGVVGKAHARQMDSSARKAWAAELGRNQSKNLDAPGWMWRSVVELIASHETAYLEHCRRYATA